MILLDRHIVTDRDGTGRGVKIAVIDTGLDLAIRDTKIPAIGIGFGDPDDPIFDGPDDPFPGGHGTHCAGVIGGGEPYRRKPIKRWGIMPPEGAAAPALPEEAPASCEMPEPAVLPTDNVIVTAMSALAKTDAERLALAEAIRHAVDKYGQVTLGPTDADLAADALEGVAPKKVADPQP